MPPATYSRFYVEGKKKKKKRKALWGFSEKQSKEEQKKGPLKRFQKESKLTVEAHDIERLDATVIEQGLQFFGGIRLKIKTRAPAPFLCQMGLESA
jgi:hypothetical protein